MTYKYTIKFEVDVINPKYKTLSVSRKKGTTILTTEYETEEEILAKYYTINSFISISY